MSSARSQAVVVLLAVVACGGPRAAPVTTVGPAPASPPDAAVDAPAYSQDEQLAAIGHAMTELDAVAHACWAAAAVVDYELEGELTAQIDIGSPGARPGAAITIVKDTARAPRLAACMTEVLAAYPWAPPLRGQVIQLPFQFRAPDGQSVIDRRLVPAAGQGGVTVQVLLDDKNTGDHDASMFEVAIAAGATTGMRSTDRDELWYALTPGTFTGVGGAPLAAAAGDVVWVPRGGARSLTAGAADLRAVLITVPGGREGAARGGALPTPPLTTIRAAPVGPKRLRLGAPSPTAGGQVTHVDGQEVHAGLLELPAGATVSSHAHERASVLLYVLAGAGTITVDKTALPFGPTSVLQVPASVPHAVAITAALRAVWLTTPAGPAPRQPPELLP